MLAIVRPAGAGGSAPAGAAGARCDAAWRGARELLLDNPLTRLIKRVALGGAVRRPGRVLCVGLVLAAARLGP